VGNENKNLTPTCIIYIDGKRMDNSYDGALLSVRTHNCLDGMPCAVITFDYTNKELKYETDFSMESEVTITLGYKDDMQEVFSGEITKRGIHLMEYGEQTFDVKVSSYMQRLKHGKHCTAWENKTASQTVKALLEKYGLSAECDDFGAEQPYVEQSNMTDYDFLFQKTVTYGRFVYAEGKKIYISSLMTNHKDDIVLEWGKSLVSTSAAEDITEVLSSVSCVGWSVMKCGSFTSTVRLADIPVKIGGEKSWADGSPSAALYNETETSASFIDQADAEAVAKGRLQYNSYRFASAEGKTEGNAKIFPGMRVTMKYIGTQYSGEYLVDEVEHELSCKNGFETRFSLMRNMIPGENRKESDVDEMRKGEQKQLTTNNLKGNNISENTKKEIHVPEGIKREEALSEKSVVIEKKQIKIVATITNIEKKGIDNETALGILVVTLEGYDRKITAKFKSGGKPYGKYIPVGKYDILQPKKNGPRHYRLEAKDKNYGDDAVNGTNQATLRLHELGHGYTMGCISVIDDTKWKQIDALIQKAEKSDVIVKQMIRNFPKSSIPLPVPIDKNETEVLEKYGTLEVIISEIDAVSGAAPSIK
jgi:phage protein D